MDRNQEMRQRILIPKEVYTVNYPIFSNTFPRRIPLETHLEFWNQHVRETTSIDSTLLADLLSAANMKMEYPHGVPVAASLCYYNNASLSKWSQPTPDFLKSTLAGPVIKDQDVKQTVILEVTLGIDNAREFLNLASFIRSRVAVNNREIMSIPGVPTVVQRIPMTYSQTGQLDSWAMENCSTGTGPSFVYSTDIKEKDQTHGFPVRVFLGDGYSWAAVVNFDIYQDQYGNFNLKFQDLRGVTPEILNAVFTDCVFLNEGDKSALESGINYLYRYQFKSLPTKIFKLERSACIQQYVILAGTTDTGYDPVSLSVALTGSVRGPYDQPDPAWCRKTEVRVIGMLESRLPENYLKLAINHLRVAYDSYVILVGCILSQRFSDPESWVRLTRSSQSSAMYLIGSFLLEALNGYVISHKELQRLQSNLSVAESLECFIHTSFNGYKVTYLGSDSGYMKALKIMFQESVPTVQFGGFRFLTAAKHDALRSFKLIVQSGFVPPLLDGVSLLRLPSDEEINWVSCGREDLTSSARWCATQECDSPGPGRHPHEVMFQLDPFGDLDIQIAQLSAQEFRRDLVSLISEWGRLHHYMIPGLFLRLKILAGSGVDISVWSKPYKHLKLIFSALNPHTPLEGLITFERDIQVAEGPESVVVLPKPLQGRESVQTQLLEFSAVRHVKSRIGTARGQTRCSLDNQKVSIKGRLGWTSTKKTTCRSEVIPLRPTKAGLSMPKRKGAARMERDRKRRRAYQAAKADQKRSLKNGNPGTDDPAVPLVGCSATNAPPARRLTRVRSNDQPEVLIVEASLEDMDLN